jgi:membrane protein
MSKADRGAATTGWPPLRAPARPTVRTLAGLPTTGMQVSTQTQRDERARGRDARRPSEISRPGWGDIAARVRSEVKEDRISFLAAACAYYGFLALFPTLIALVSIYGLLVEPQQVQQQVDQLARLLPGEVASLVEAQLRDVVTAGTGALTAGAVISLVAALWAASSGTQGLMEALTLAYDEAEDRGFLVRRGTALALTVGALSFAIVTFAVLVILPLAFGGAGETAARVARWPLLGVALVAGLAVVYRYGPDRDAPKFRWVSWGAVLAAVLWVAATAAFSFYVANFGTYNETYGALGAVIVLLLWLFLSALVVIVGAEVNAEIEHQTLRDTTVGPDRPLGERGARVADSIGPARAPRGSAD